MYLPILQLSYRLFFLAKHHITQVCQSSYSPDLAPCNFWSFPKAKIFVEREEICKCDGNTVHKLSQRRLTADWLAPRESDCSRMHSKVSSDWLPSYIKATRPVLEIYKMAGYFPNSPRTSEVWGTHEPRFPCCGLENFSFIFQSWLNWKLFQKESSIQVDNWKYYRILSSLGITS